MPVTARKRGVEHPDVQQPLDGLRVGSREIRKDLSTRVALAVDGDTEVRENLGPRLTRSHCPHAIGEWQAAGDHRLGVVVAVRDHHLDIRASQPRQFEHRNRAVLMSRSSPS